MSELEFFLLKGVLSQNVNTMDLVKNFKKNQRLHIESDIIQNHEQKSKVKKVKNHNSMGKSNFFS
jgi:phosphomevalonate kinase